MGWDYTKGATKANVVAELVKDRPGYNYKTLTHKTVGNTLWAVVESDGRTEIVCYFLSNNKGYGWGYKGGTPESNHPYQYDCPLDFLSLAPETCPEWRQAVRKHHRPLAIGQTYTLVGVSDPTISPITIIEITATKIIGLDTHKRRWRIKRDHLGEEVKS